MTPRAIVSTFLKIVNKVTVQQLPARAARGRSARGNGTICHNASHLAARHKTAAGKSWYSRLAALAAP